MSGFQHFLSLLKIHYLRDQQLCQLFNPFPTIAVWAAVRLMTQENKGLASMAFMPLISDPGEAERRKLFRNLTLAETKLLSENREHPAMFACIMRRRTVMNDIQNPAEDSAGNKKSLECHAFICKGQADAIAIAAQLYQALVETIRRNNAEINNGKNSFRVSIDDLYRSVLEVYQISTICLFIFDTILKANFGGQIWP